jgi:hypothetical protein
MFNSLLVVQARIYTFEALNVYIEDGCGFAVVRGSCQQHLVVYASGLASNNASVSRRSLDFTADHPYDIMWNMSVWAWLAAPSTPDCSWMVKRYARRRCITPHASHFNLGFLPQHLDSTLRAVRFPRDLVLLGHPQKAGLEAGMIVDATAVRRQLGPAKHIIIAIRRISRRGSQAPLRFYRDTDTELS